MSCGKTEADKLYVDAYKLSENKPFKITMTTPKATDVKKGISVLWETLQCPICLDLMSAPVSTKCDHQFCKFCITKLLDNSKQNRANCPVCKFKITKRSLQESPGFQRLVAGLQDMIQAYEHDTCTNYFTGLPQQRKNTKNTETSKDACDLSFGDPSGIEQSNKGTEHRNDSPQSCSSTVAAQNGFAQLMGLEDSASVTAENEGLDSGLGDVPPTSDKKMSDNLEPETANVGKNATDASKNKRLKRKPEKASNCLDSTQEEPGQQNVRKSSRKKQKNDLEHKILEQKKKKSLEKVAEWLLKVPAEEELELEKPLHSEDDSDSSSSSLILDVEPQNVELSPKRKHRGKAIEEQVFGVIYKRRGSKVTEPLTAGEIETCKRFSKLKKKNNVRLCEERQTVENDTGSDFFKELEQMAVEEKVEETVEKLNQKVSDKYKGEHEVPVADFIQPETTAPTRRTCKSLQQPESDLQEQTQLKSKGTDKKSDCRKEKNSKLSRKKPTKVAKPLVLVEVQDRETSPKPSERVKEVEVRIETYPSSEEQITPVMKSARKSRRLQLFVDEVHGSHKKTTNKVTATKTDKVAKKQSDETMDATPSKSGNLMKEAKRNRCVTEEDIGVIENVEKRGRMSLSQAEAEVPEAQTLAKPECTVSVVPNSTSPTDPSIVGPTLESEKQENNRPPGSRQETFANVEEYEDGKNDSELDTEQLLQSFKASKRKSFLLGDPNAKRSRSLDVENAERSQHNCSSAELSENINQVSKSNCSDVISPSNSPSKIRKPDQALLDASNPDGNCPSRSNVGSGLSPNKVAKCDRDSPLSVVPQVVDSGLRFIAVEQEAANASQGNYNLTEIPDGISKCPSDNKTETIFVGESSLTPDQEVKEANGSGEVSTQSSIQTNQKKKRKTQRLESSSESSSSSKEELPTLAQIFGTLDRPQAEIKHQGEIGEANRLEGVGEEPLGRPAGSLTPDQLDSSQASVDLFGTPEECDAPENCVGVCFESSQFSNEVLVTQQKIEMQKELVRLEKLMALVSEVLQGKEGSPAAETNQCCENKGPELDEQDQVQSSDRTDILDAETKAPDDKVAERGGFSGTAVQDLTHAESIVKDTKTPNSISATKTAKTCDSPPDCQEDKENNSPPKEKSKAKLVLVSSGLGPNEQIVVKMFAKRVGGRVVSRVTPEVTHIVMRTDDQLVCERTLKYFLGIAGRKWVVSFQWISECFKEKKLLKESSFEVRGDVVNGPNHQGPLRARTAGDSNLLMKGYKICFQGPFPDMSTDEMEWMVELCGATVVKDPLVLDGEQKSHQIVIVQPRSDSSSSSCYSALSRNAAVVTRGWLLDSVATYTLQNYSGYNV